MCLDSGRLYRTILLGLSVWEQSAAHFTLLTVCFLLAGVDEITRVPQRAGVLESFVAGGHFAHSSPCAEQRSVEELLPGAPLQCVATPTFIYRFLAEKAPC